MLRPARSPSIRWLVAVSSVTRAYSFLTVEIISRAISRARLTTLAEAQFGDIVKAVVDVERIRQVVTALVAG